MTAHVGNQFRNSKTPTPPDSVAYRMGGKPPFPSHFLHSDRADLQKVCCFFRRYERFILFGWIHLLLHPGCSERPSAARMHQSWRRIGPENQMVLLTLNVCVPIQSTCNVTFVFWGNVDDRETG